MEPDTKKMYFLNEFCCICMNKSDLKNLFDVDCDGISHYNKLTSSIAEMNFKEMNDQRLICGECCVTLNTVYNFRQTCLRSKTNLITYLSQLQTSSNVSGLPSDAKVEKEGIEIKSKNDGNRKEKLHEFQNESSEYIVHSPASVKEEFESEEDTRSAHEDTTADHVNENFIKIEDVVQQTTMEDEPFIEYSETGADIEEDPLAVVKEEPMSDTETPQDGSTSQGTSVEAKTSKESPKTETENTISIKKLHRIYQCLICKEYFNTKEILDNHIKLHSQRFECEICKKTFTMNNNLTAHMKLHASEKPYECEICKKGFIRKNYLASHMKTHTGERPFECEICKKTFAHKSSYNVHLRIHSNERPYECMICPMKFFKKTSLDAHMVTHTGVKQYGCKICSKRFINKYNLSKHTKMHVDLNVCL